MFNRKKDSHEFKPLLVEIEDEPVNPLGRAIFWIIIVAILFFSIWMYFGKVDVVVTARGKIIPVGESKIIQPLNTGVVRNIFIKPGDFVEKDQVLMEIDPSDIEPELESMKADLKQIRLEVLRLESLLGNTPFNPNAEMYDPVLLKVQHEIFTSTKKRLVKQIRVKNEELTQGTERLASEKTVLQQAESLYNININRLKRLSKVQDIISRDEYEKVKGEVITYLGQIKTTTHTIEELFASKSRVIKEIDLIKEDERNKLLNELSEKRTKYLYLKARIEKAEYISKQQQITSPVKGYVGQLFVHTIGGVVTPAEKLASIVPSGSPLVIKALVLNKDVGFISSGMNASIKVDAFSFQKYGLLSGEVLQISKDSIEDKNFGLVYEAYIRPNETYLMVEGVKTQVSTGMGVTAELKVGKRRIIEFFIYPLIKYLDEGISVR